MGRIESDKMPKDWTMWILVAVVIGSLIVGIFVTLGWQWFIGQVEQAGVANYLNSTCEIIEKEGKTWYECDK